MKPNKQINQQEKLSTSYFILFTVVDWFVNGEMKPNKQTKKVNQLLYLFKGKIALQSISYTVKMQQKYLQQRCYSKNTGCRQKPYQTQIKQNFVL